MGAFGCKGICGRTFAQRDIDSTDDFNLYLVVGDVCVDSDVGEEGTVS